MSPQTPQGKTIKRIGCGYVRFTSALSFVLASILASAQDPPANTYTLDALQGAWWLDCEAPAAEFFIDGSEYAGDFEGSHQLTLAGDIVTFNGGFADGHSVNVTHRPLSFQILKLSRTELVLRPLSGDSYPADLSLQSCDETPGFRP